MLGLLGKKIAMTSIFDPATGKQSACTIVELGPCVVTQIKGIEKEGYDSVQIAFMDKKAKRTNKAEAGHFKASGSPVKRCLREIRDFESPAKVGDTLNVSLLAEGDKVSVIGISKGKGFQGVVKRHGFRGVGESSHGQHDRQRAPGSVGGSSFPSRVFKGLRMAGRMGGNRVKIKGISVLKIFADKNCVLLKGAIPGHKGSLLFVEK